MKNTGALFVMQKKNYDNRAISVSICIFGPRAECVAGKEKNHKVRIYTVRKDHKNGEVPMHSPT